MKKHVIAACTIVFVIVALLFIDIKGDHKQGNDGKLYKNNVDEVIELMNTGKSEVDYKKYIMTELKSVKFSYNDTNENKTVDNDNCCISYEVYFKNISKEKIIFNYRIFLPKELTSIIFYSPTSVGPSMMVNELEPGLGVNISFNVIMKHTDKLSESEKELLNDFKKQLYFQFIINSKNAYGKF